MESVTATQSTTQTSKVAQSLRDGATALNSDFQTFLEMLTVQAQNQDPLNPMDSTEYASQLASFSSVEQQVKTNDLLLTLTEKISASNLSELSSWVGMDVRSEGETYFDGASRVLHPSYEKFASSAQLVAHDTAGREVFRADIDLGLDTLHFTGQQEDGSRLPEGIYKYSVESFSEGKSLGTHPVSSYQRVLEAQVENGSVKMRLDGGVMLDASDVTALRS